MTNPANFIGANAAPASDDHNLLDRQHSAAPDSPAAAPEPPAGGLMAGEIVPPAAPAPSAEPERAEIRERASDVVIDAMMDAEPRIDPNTGRYVTGPLRGRFAPGNKIGPRFRPGESGNPHGRKPRPKNLNEFRELIQDIWGETVPGTEYTRVEKMLRDMLTSERPQDRELLIRYAVGNVPQTLIFGAMTNEQLIGLILQEVGGPQPRAIGDGVDGDSATEEAPRVANAEPTERD